MANLGVSTPVQIKSTVIAYVQNPKTITSNVGYSWSKLSIGNSHVLALRSDRTLWAWGYNASGQLGDGTATTKSSPVQIGNSLWSQISAGYNYSLGLKQDNTLFAWGDNTNSKLGSNLTPFAGSLSFDGASQYLTVPDSASQRVGTNSFTIEAWVFITTTDTNSIYSKGASGTAGIYFGVRNSTNILVFQTAGTDLIVSTTAVVLNQWTHVAVSRDSSNNLRLFINGYLESTVADTTNFPDTADGRIGRGRGTSTNYFWGRISNFRLVIGTAVYTSNFVPPTEQLTAITNTSLLLNTPNNANAFVDSSTNNVTVTNVGTVTATSNAPIAIVVASPTQIGTSSWVAITTGTSHAAAIRSDKTLWVWGDNTLGQLGRGFNVAYISGTSSPIQVGTSSYTQVAANNNYTLAVDITSKLYSWGDNSYGQLGYTNNTPTTYSWLNIAASDSHTVAIRTDGLLFAWGLNNAGQVGDGTTIDKSSPIQIGTSSWSLVAAGLSTTFATRSDGRLFTWGLNANGQLGLGSIISQSSPTQVNSTTSYINIASGGSTGVAIKNDYTLWACGAAPGQGDTIARSSLTQVGTSSWTQIAGTLTATFGIKTDKTLWAWGHSNTFGQLGDGTTISKSSPIAVAGSWTSISGNAGDNAVYAIDISNRLFGWGGTLLPGDGNSTIYRSSPAQISSSNTWSKVSHAAANVGVGIKTDGSLWMWGSSTTGTTSNDFMTDGSSGTFTYSWIQISSANNTTGAIRSDGRLFVWGNNASGQLGDGTTTTRSSPIQVGTGDSGLGGYWNSIAIGQGHALAIQCDNTLWAWGNSSAGQLAIAPLSWTSILANNNTQVLRSDGTIWVWGSGADGVLGQGNTLSRSNPIQLGTDNSWISLAASTGTGTFNAAIRNDYTLWMWGNNLTGQLAQSDIIYRSSPVQVGGSWSQVTLGTLGIAGIRTDGTLWTWGQNNVGQLGDGTIFNKSSPVQVLAGGSWTQVRTQGIPAANVGHTLAIKNNGTLWAWGYNLYGQLGDGASGTTTNKSSPSQVGTSSWTAIAAGANHSLAIDLLTRKVWAWGNTGTGQLGTSLPAGTGGTNSRSAPTQITTLTGSYIAVAASGSGTTIGHSFAIGTDKTLWVWGYNASGQLGDGTILNRSAPVQITGSYSSVSAGQTNAAAIKTDNTAYVWGGNANGQLGDGTTINKSSPVQVPSFQLSPKQIGTSSWTQISAGDSHSIAIDSNNKLYTWGLNSFGQLGDSTSISKSSPTQIGTSSWSLISAGTAYSLATKEDKTLYGWGDTTYSQSGQPYLSISMVLSGYSTTVAIANSKLYVWGDNTYGQLGLGDTISRSSPTQLGTDSWISVDTGFSHVAAIKSNGTLWTWGGNGAGQLGQGDILPRSTPTQLAGSYTTVVTGVGGITYAIKSDGTLWGWGNNNHGQTGDGTVVLKSSPVQISTSSWIVIAATANHVAGIKIDNTLYTWGWNQFGELGLGHTLDRSSPTQVGTNANWFAVACAPTEHTHALYGMGKGLLYAWGYNGQGQLGDGTTVNKSSPVAVAAGVYHTAICADNFYGGVGQGYHAAIRDDGTIYASGLNDTTLSLGSTYVTRSSPVQIHTTIAGATDIHAGYQSLYIKTYGPIAYGVGNNNAGQLGDVTLINRSSPVQLSFTQQSVSSPTQIGTTSYSLISAGGSHALGIATTGYLYGWGLNNLGQAGIAQVDNSPILSSGLGSGLLASTTGLLYLWGSNTSGGLGTGDTLARSSPVQIAAATRWTKIAKAKTGTAASDYTLGVRNDGKLFGWGINTAGQLGMGDTITRSFPVQIGSSSWSTVSAGGSHSLAIRADGGLFMWGLNTSGQLGQNTVTSRSSPVQVGTSSWTAIAAGGTHSVAILSTGGLFAWGDNTNGKLGSNTTALFAGSLSFNGTSQYLTVPSTGLALSGNQFTIECWVYLTSYSPGYLSYYNSAIFSTTAPNGFQFTIRGTASTYTGFQLYAGTGGTINDTASTYSFQLNTWYHVALTRATGGVFVFYVNGVNVGTFTNTSTWTENTPYGIGRNNQSGYEYYFPGYISNFRIVIGAPVYTTAFTPPTAPLTAITNTSLLLNTPNNANAFVDSSTNNITVTNVGTVTASSNAPDVGYSSPTQIGTSSWSVISSGDAHSMALDINNNLYAWGLNSSGQLGQVTDTVARSSPTQVGTSQYAVISAGMSHSGALRAVDNTLWIWGNNAVGQLGDNTIISKSSPVQINNSSSGLGDTNWGNISLGASHTVAVTGNSLYVWGGNAGGQLGDGTVVAKLSPILLTTLFSVPAVISTPMQIGANLWSTVSAGSSTSVGVTTSYSLFSWGDNAGGQFGNSTTITRSSPTQITTVNSYVSISAGTSYTYAIATTTNLMYAWGLNTSGQLADSTIINKSSPIQINTATMAGAAYIPINLTAVRGSSWTQVAAGNAITAIANNSLLYTWGYNIGGTIGNLTIDSSSSPTVLGNASIPLNASPTQIGISSWTTISAGNKHVLALKSDSTLWAWGGRASLVPMKLEYTQIEAGYSHFIALRSDGSIWTWGDNTYGQLGDTSIVNKSSPIQIGTSSWSVVAAGISHTAGIKADGTLWVWGLGTGGQLGQGDTINRSSPTQVGTSSWTLVAAGSSHTIAVGQNNLGLYAWGYNVAGQLGDNTVVAKSSPILVSGTSTTSFIQLAAGNQNSMFLNSNFGAYVWGSGNTGQLGNGLTTSKSSPTQVGALLYKAITLSTDSAVTGATSYAIRTDGILYAWGLGTSGQLGDATIVSKSSPIQVNSTNSYDKIKGAHNNHVQGLRSDGTLWVWGLNTSGALGDGTTINKSSPAQLSTFTYGNVGAGPSLTSAYLDRLGQLYTTGVTSAALGSFNTPNTTGAISRSSPAQIGYYIGNSPIQIGSNSWSAISAGNDSSLIANSTKALYFWGVNSNYQSGNVSTPVTANVSSPTLIGTAASSISDGNVNAGYIKKS